MQSPSPSLAWNGNFEEAEVWPTLFCFLPLFLLHGRGSSSWVLCSKTNHCHIDRPTRELAPWHAKLSTEFPQALTEILEMVRLRLHEVCSCCSLTVLTGPAIDLLNMFWESLSGLFTSSQRFSDANHSIALIHHSCISRSTRKHIAWQITDAQI